MGRMRKSCRIAQLKKLSANRVSFSEAGALHAISREATRTNARTFKDVLGSISSLTPQSIAAAARKNEAVERHVNEYSES
jgi:predicted Zn-dependent peptidase